MIEKSNGMPAGFCLFAGTILLRFYAFTGSTYANGWDSYFYLVQLKSWVETGVMHSPEASLFYPFVRSIQFIFGDYVLAFKAAVALLCGFFAVMAWRISAYRLWAAIFLLFSPQLTWFAAQYPKNLFGMVLLLPLIACLLDAFQSAGWPAARQASCIAGLLLLNYLGHRFTFALGILACASFGGALYWRERLGSIPIFRKKTGLALIVALILLTVGLPGLAHYTDFGRLSGTFTYKVQFAPWSFVQDYGYARIGLFWGLELAFAVFCWLFLVSKLVRQKQSARFWAALPWTILLSALLFPFLQWSPTGLSFRAFALFVLLAPLAFFAQQTVQKDTPKAWWATGLAAIVFFAMPCTYDHRLHDPDYAFYARITPKIMLFLEKQPQTLTSNLLIAHNSLAEYFTFSTGVDAMPWLPEYAIGKESLWRICVGVSPQYLQYYGCDTSKMLDLGRDYVFLREIDWKNAAEAAKKAEDDDFLDRLDNWKNPNKTRPNWLLRRKNNMH
jgi:hypothetical protein